MKTTRQKKSKKILLSLLAVLILILIAFGLIFTLKHNFSSNTPEQINSTNKPSSQEQVDNGNSIKEENAKPSPQQDENSTDNTNGQFSVTISAANQTEDIIQIRTLIQTIANTGNCTLTLTNGSSSLQRTASIQPSASNSTCQGFDIPRADLYPGTWSIKITVALPQGTSSTTGTIEIQ